ncbi:endonuclease/exonuclease/phosphatase family protein [Azospirillum sp. YIM DDC1]|uniref:Endonuclease/exonuclease/phosphatase family protein n=1 Tax=Azospirillum aestuarii TaxID=2802052 RepID=A0ABS1HXF0_9PROT|nr:endonuclease/exonuclease/phosphatase family protein [Azospirillum aestuarii]TWA95672.1 endonuclease/exonuclease/phosphatase family metal-dependent hydrolase [Azospirillum brasilense]
MIRFSRERVQRIASALRAARVRRPKRRVDSRSGPVPEGMAPLRVATWNIHSCVGLDARFAPDRIAEVIKELDVDLVGLQEVGWHHRGESGLDQFAFLERATGLKAHAGPTKHNAHAHYGNAILTRLPVLKCEPIDLSVGRREPRGGIDVIVEVQGRPVRIIVAHLGLDPWERARQVGAIVDRLEEQPALPTLFMGDLNEWAPNSPRLRKLAEAFPDWASPRSFHARMPTLRLDRIYVNNGLTIPSYEVVRTVLTRRASDHLPVRATVAVP